MGARYELFKNNFGCHVVCGLPDVVICYRCRLLAADWFLNFFDRYGLIYFFLINTLSLRISITMLRHFVKV